MSIRHRSPSGPVAEWLNVDTAGWPLRDAQITLVQDVIHSAVRDGGPVILEDSTGSRRTERSFILPNGRSPMLIPRDVHPWWGASDIHTPALLCKLISGRLVAFGDPGTTGAQPYWIAPRQWQQLRFDTRDVSEPVTGAGAVFWNVRVLDLDEYHGLATAMECDSALLVSPTPTATAAKGKGGRPKHNTYEAFVAELVRHADLDGLEETKSELKAYMARWLDQNFGDDVPADSSVDNWLAKLAPYKP